MIKNDEKTLEENIRFKERRKLKMRTQFKSKKIMQGEALIFSFELKMYDSDLVVSSISFVKALVTFLHVTKFL